MPEIGCFVDTGSGAVMHVPKSCVSKQKDVDSCRFLSVLSCKHGRRGSSKVRRRPRQWHVQGRSTMTRVWLSNIIPDHCPELTKKQLHTMNGCQSRSLFLVPRYSFSSLHRTFAFFLSQSVTLPVPSSSGVRVSCPCVTRSFGDGATLRAQGVCHPSTIP